MPTQIPAIFVALTNAVREGRLITSGHKEFHFQDWVQAILEDAGVAFDPPKRNTFPDFTLVHSPEGIEVKGLAFPGRETTFDCNSQIPKGQLGERQMFYLFGRYPKDPDDADYPCVDMVLCHGSLLNADASLTHKRNQSLQKYGSFGDILLRDRRMYAAPTPYVLLRQTAAQFTLILPAEHEVNGPLVQVGEFTRTEVDEALTGYEFDFVHNKLTAKLSPNPRAGIEHVFRAYRREDIPGPAVGLAEGVS